MGNSYDYYTGEAPMASAGARAAELPRVGVLKVAKLLGRSRATGAGRRTRFMVERRAMGMGRGLAFVATVSSVLVLLVGFGALSGCCRTRCTDRTGCHWQCRVGQFPDDEEPP